jgi:hypothetical protein
VTIAKADVKGSRRKALFFSLSFISQTRPLTVVIKIDSMQKHIDFSSEQKRLVKKLCLTQTYVSSWKMNNVILILAFLALCSEFVACEYPGKREFL